MPFLRILLAIWCMVSATHAVAQSFADINADALKAFNNGDIGRAMALTREVVKGGEAKGREQPAAFLEALNNLTYLESIDGAVTDEELGLAERAFRFAQETQQLGAAGGVLAASNAARVNSILGDASRATEVRQILLSANRGNMLHGAAVTAAVDLAFQNKDFGVVPLLIEEMISVAGGYFAQTTLDQLYQQQEILEQQRDVAGASALIDARILWVGAQQPHLLDEFAHAALWQKFFLNYEVENFSTAAKALRIWAETGTLSAAEVGFIEEQAASALAITQLQGFSGRAGLQLGFAELALAFAELAYSANDSRIGLALREKAFAEAQLNLFERASETLQDALVNLSKSSDGDAWLYLVLEDLASNALQRGELDLSHDLFDRASASYQAAMAGGATPLADMDRSILFLNRARLQIERGALADAEEQLQQANALFTRFVESGAAKKNDLRHYIGLAETRALLAGSSNDAALALQATREVVNLANQHLPDIHPARALALTNAADQLMVLGAADLARELLHESLSIADSVLPKNASLRSEILLKLALDALKSGARNEAVSLFRQVIDARKSPEFRGTIAEVSADFEMFAWALLNGSDTSPDRVDEALAALQWTQTSQSAESYAMMAARLAVDDQSVSTLIKQGQDARIKLEHNRSALNSAYASGADPAPILARRQALQAELQRADNALNSAGVALTGQAAITPLTLSDIQARLGPDEVLVTFLLPGLSSDALPDLNGSSNLAIAIRSDAYLMAAIPEESRGVLNSKIDRFRCTMAIGEGGCDTGLAAQLRGAMALNETGSSDPGFDWTVAHDLYVDLFGGVDSLLQPNDHLIIVPPGDLLRLPFQALLTDIRPGLDMASADWLIRRHAISVLPSIAAFDVLKGSPLSTHNDTRFLGIGDPVIGTGPDMNCAGIELAALRSAGAGGANLYGTTRENGVRLASVDRLRQMQRLPDATCELKAIETAFGPRRSQLLIREQATETELKRLSAAGELQSYGLIVFATHGVVSGETSAIAPGLVLTPPTKASLTDDGLLTAAEVANLSFSARLVILSACNTAAGSAASEEGLSGLASGFFHAGVRSLMVTHWAVYSDASARISSSLSKRMAADHTLPVARALRQVIVDILENPTESPRARHPAYWAPFAIIGL